ncbi:Acetyltransferase component of pyruvate dehydrogenase complex [Rhizoctonia solani]|uniref:Mitochondrial distribution and morphology protein 12 n=1 Tax=Rhizoctonia solani TaxID=456999 RepID=A0A8H7M5N6_9AGAM|nr:Acetyltransferase component of pyruvate dehydrogenase complex [Rhizoctonia solani]
MAALRVASRLASRRITPGLARSIQTSADTTELRQSVPSSGSEPFTLRLHEDSFQAYRCDSPGLDVQVTKDMLVDMYRQMTIMRRMEMAADALYKAKLIRGFCHLAIGQEAVSVVLRGGTVKGVIAELLGRQAGMSNGKGGSMHIFTPSFFGGNGIVGAKYQLALGLLLPKSTVSIQAKLWNLPCVFVCENNKYGMGTSAERSSSNTEYFKRGDLIPGIQVNGMDIIASHQGQICSMSDPGTTYRTREEIQRMRSTQDPIKGLQKYLEDWGVASEEELKTIDKEAKAEVDKAVEEAKASPEPDPKDLWTDIYYKGTEPPYMRGREREEQSLADTLVDALNRTLASASRPSFIGPSEVTSFEFGSNPPEIEVVDVRDIHPDFLEEYSEDEGSQDGGEGVRYDEEEEEYEWVPRRRATREIPEMEPRSPGMGSPFAARMGNVGIGFSPLGGRSGRRTPQEEERTPEEEVPPVKPPTQTDEESKQAPEPAPAPALQMHLHVLFHSNLRLTIKTSVLLNYPSESFLTLPVKLRVTGLVFDGEVVVAYEGPRRRVHICIVDDLDPYGLASDRRNRRTDSNDSLSRPGAENGPPRTPERMQPSPSPIDRSLPIGQRLLPSILIETEIGQTDKHVLRNVSRVERFLQDVLRKTLEDELVFPNFHTIILS